MATTEITGQVLDGARRALELHGWSGTTLERIAEQSAVSRMTLHRHGVSRASVLDVLAERLGSEHRSAMFHPLTAEGTGCARLRMALEVDCDVTERNLALLEALSAAEHAAIHHTEAGGDAAVLTRPDYTDALRRLLEDGGADGSLRPVDPGETATVLANLVGPTYRHLRCGHRWSPERARGAVLDIALNGLVA